MSAASHRVTFGIKTSQAGIAYEDIVRFWREADAVAGFEHAWLWDHLVPLRGDVRGPALEAWTLLAALAAQTRRLSLGVIVTSNRIRPPAVLAKMAATVDVISGGRLVLGIGAGGSRVADPDVVAGVHREYDPYGIDVVGAGEAITALGEACTIVKRMWSEEQPFDFDGRCYRLRGAICEPKPVQRPGPPLLIGAGGERRALRVVAEHAAIWSAPTRTIEEFRHKSAVLDEHCLAVGRDPVEVIRSKQIIVRAADQSGAAAAVETVLEHIDAGASHFVLAPLPPLPPAEWLAENISERALEQVGRREGRDTGALRAEL